MEALAAVQTISSIVQLVDFGSKCLTKGLQLYRSSSGAQDENLAIEISTTHLIALTDSVDKAIFLATDQGLKDLCGRVTVTAQELLEVLRQLQVQGSQTKWKCMRKAIKSVWGIEKVSATETKLVRYREELNLHITISSREMIQQAKTQVDARFDNCDARLKEVIDALLTHRDVFQSTSDHKFLLQGLESEEALQQDIRNVFILTKSVVKDESNKTRAITQDEADRVIQANATSLQSVDANLQDLIKDNAQASGDQHQQTQADIAKLQQQLSHYATESERRHQELRETIEALKVATSQKQKDSLLERSNALAATLVALNTMYTNVKAALAASNIAVADWAQWSRTWSEVPRSGAPQHDLTLKPRVGGVMNYTKPHKPHERWIHRPPPGWI